MILLPLIALILGFALFYYPLHGFSWSESLAPYTAIALLAGFDTVLGGWRAWLINEFDDFVFVSGFFVNALLAAGLVSLGERLGLESGFADGRISIMMIGAVVVFSMRIFNNLAVLRRLLIERMRERRLADSVEITTLEPIEATHSLPPSPQTGRAA
jgi:small basic protein